MNPKVVTEFKKVIEKAKNILVITGAGISAESGIPTFRGSGGFWRKMKSESLATVAAFNANPSLVWEFYHYRRELCLTVEPNKSHISLAKFEARCLKEKKKFTLVTQNVDGLHERAGSRNIIEFHGSLYKTRCTKCGDIKVNRNSPICEALRGRGEPDYDRSDSIDADYLPKCLKCSGLLRPNVVWFGESIPEDCRDLAETTVEECDLCLVIGTSAVVMPIASYPCRVSERGIPVAEFNIEPTVISKELMFTFLGPSAVTLSQILDTL